MTGAELGRDGGSRITEEHDADWARHGYTIVEGFLEGSALAAVRENFELYYPTPEEYEAQPFRYEALRGGQFTGLREGPFQGDALNNAGTHPEIVAFAERVLGSRDLLLTQSNIWAKYAGAADYDQALHMDYMNHTLTVPRDDPGFRQLHVLIYLTDVTIDHGPTYVVSREHTRHLPLQPFHYTREERPELYEHEVPVVVPAGALMAYTSATFHRGSAFRAREGGRLVYGVSYRTAGTDWSGYRTWPFHGPRPEMTRFIEQATPRQRELLGFPPPGHEFWTAETVEGVGLRYPEMDLAPYRAALG